MIKTGIKIFISFVIFTSVLAPSAARAEEWKLSLDKALSQALEANRDIAIAKERLSELEGLKSEALSTWLPQLTGNAAYDRVWRRPEMSINGIAVRIGMDHMYTAGANLSQMLWDGGKVLGAMKAARLEKLRGIEDIKQVEDAVRFEVKQTYYQILYTEKMIDVLERQLKQLKGHLSAIETRFGKGIESDYTVMRQEVEVANVEPQLIDAKRARELLMNGLKIVLAIPPQDNVAVIGGFEYRTTALPNVEELSDKALAKRPDLNSSKLRGKSLSQLVSMEKAGYWPTLAFDADLKWQGQSNTFDLSPDQKADSLTTTVSFSWPLFDGLKTAARVRQAKARFLAQQYESSKVGDGVVREVKDAYEILVRSREALRVQQKTLASARRAAEIAGERFTAGLMSQLELNDTITAEARSEQLYLQASFECMTAEAALEKSVGGEF